MTPRISIVTPCFNARATIERTFRSIRASRYPSLDYVVVDGGSTDGTLDVIHANRDIIGTFVSEADRGISDAFNKGIRLAKGDVVGIVSADDFLVPKAPFDLADAITADPDADVYYGDALAIEGTSVVANPVPRAVVAPIRRVPLKHSAMWIRKRAYERWGGYDERFRLAMDQELAIRFSAGGARFRYVPGYLGAYRAGGVNTRRRVASMIEVFRILLASGTPLHVASADLARKLGLHAARNVLPRTWVRRLTERRRERIGVVTIDPAALGISDFI